MITTTLILVILFLIFKWSVAWINYYNQLDLRLTKSVWKWSYDYPVIGKRDISMLDDKNYVLIRRKRNRAITIMYLIVFLFFLVLMSFTSQILLVILT